MQILGSDKFTSVDQDLRHGNWKDLVVICAGTAWDSGWFPSEKHIAVCLSRWVPVLYVDPPMSVIARRRRHICANGLRQVRPRIAVLTPNAPPAGSRPFLRHVTAVLTRQAIARAVKTLGQSHPLALIVANHTDMLDAVSAQVRVMYATDDFVAGADLMGLGRRYLEDEERKQASHADRVVVVTEQLGSRWQKMGHTPILIPNGCDTERFAGVDTAPWPDDVDMPRPIAGVFGHLSKRIDLELLKAVASRNLSLILVGTLQPSFQLDQLLTRPNVRYLGAKKFDAMAGYLRSIDVGLTPYADNAFNQSSFPLKTLEYLSAGRAAVSTDLPAVRWLKTNLIATASTPRSFADEVELAMSQAQTPELAQERRAFAQQHSWAVRAKRFAEVIGLALPAHVEGVHGESLPSAF